MDGENIPVNKPNEKPTENDSIAPDNPVAPMDQELKEQDTQGQTTEPTKQTPESLDTKNQPKKSKKPLLIALLVILLVGGAGAYYWFFMKDSNQSSDNTNNSTQQSVQTAPQTYTPETVVYAFKTGNDPYTVYWRPSAGGDRKEAIKLASGEVPIWSDVNGANVAFATESNVYASTDYGKSYTKIISGTGGAQITSLKFSDDNSRLAYANLPGAGGKNTVKSVNLQGQDSKDLFTSTKVGVFIIGWDVSKAKIIYQEGCYNCDGLPSLPIARDLKTPVSRTI